MTSKRQHRGEEGHLMAGLLVLLAIMLIFSTVVFQDWQDLAHRENEAEMIFRAQEISRAILRYRKDQGKAPDKLEQLMEPGSRAQYFMRRPYTDPLVEDGTWGLLYLGPGNQIIDPSGTSSIEGTGLIGLNESQMDEATREKLAADLERQRRWDKRAQESGIKLNKSGLAGQQIAGLTIAGVKSLSLEQPFRIYKEHEEYRDWLFTYLDLVLPQQPKQQKQGNPSP